MPVNQDFGAIVPTDEDERRFEVIVGFTVDGSGAKQHSEKTAWVGSTVRSH